MKKDVLIERIEELVRPIVSELSCELYYVEYVKENGEFYLRIYIDKEGRVSLNDCEAVSRRVSDVLDSEDPIKEAYYLEVSSPGLNRGLYKEEHFNKYIGREVLIRLTSSLNGVKSVKGVLRDVSEDSILVEGETEVKIPRDKIKAANLEGEI
ncbi:ribosome maturation factor RimP [Clostridium beijerinckii]|uniref:Ribosome maturation factor RimP n=2 Tax=Clostridium TaxID=1485 RepID=A0A1S8S598_CLOBE|nr:MULTISPECIES: ribosome maturation factor RimP [Clostridium]MBN7572615.1 ribosome maturation factor RimP [Clostridium beijerinckii]MBN7577558.1 ribosome maturation factor RimP [Clostridium beijerinckii]MBN7582388.1 ribosome maturation factor RimP [Clostridium beijerinckii]MBO0518734.1 ribosome maturation factor RimP [Clostridium beijerinckii]MZK52510.1 ribosome maturation factor RimP [Clostridium beijerinckii]